MNKRLNLGPMTKKKLIQFDKLKEELWDLLIDSNDLNLTEMAENGDNDYDLLHTALMQMLDEEREDDFEESLISHELYG